jgi:hypothetical protein
MSSDEQNDFRDEPEAEDEDVEAHRFVAEEPGDDDLEKRKMKMRMKTQGSEELGGDDFGKRAKF